MRGVYGWMYGGLAVTAATAWLVASSPALTTAIFGNRALFWGLAIAQLGIVFVLSARVDKMAAGTASLLFVAYSVISFIGVIVFAGLTVYDAQRLKELAFALRFVGNRRDEW